MPRLTILFLPLALIACANTSEDCANGIEKSYGIDLNKNPIQVAKYVHSREGIVLIPLSGATDVLPSGSHRESDLSVLAAGGHDNVKLYNIWTDDLATCRGDMAGIRIFAGKWNDEMLRLSNEAAR